MASNFIQNIIDEIHIFVPNEGEQQKFLLFLQYLKKSYLKPTSPFFLGEISNFQKELLGDWFPQLSNNVCESLNAILQNCYKRGYINRPSLVEGLHTFYSDRRDKYRVFISGQKVNKRKKSDLIRFQNLKFLSVKFSEIVNNPNSYFYPGYVENCFFEAIFKFARIQDPHVNEIFANMQSNALYPPQLIVPIL